MQVRLAHVLDGVGELGVRAFQELASMRVGESGARSRFAVDVRVERAEVEVVDGLEKAERVFLLCRAGVVVCGEPADDRCFDGVGVVEAGQGKSGVVRLEQRRERGLRRVGGVQRRVAGAARGKLAHVGGVAVASADAGEVGGVDADVLCELRVVEPQGVHEAVELVGKGEAAALVGQAAEQALLHCGGIRVLRDADALCNALVISARRATVFPVEVGLRLPLR